MSKKKLSIDLIHDAIGLIDPIFLNSPQFEIRSLSNALKTNLTLKVETFNPIKCFKGRGADLLLNSEQHPKLISASAGNFGQALAYCSQKKNIKLDLYVSRNANKFKIQKMVDFGANIIKVGHDFDAAKLFAKEVSKREDVPFIEDGLHIDTLIGAATIAVEISKTSKPFDYILLPIGNGALINGVGYYLKSINSSTRIVGVQAVGAPAMVNSWRKGKIIFGENVNTIADGIAVRIPIKESVDLLSKTMDKSILVTEKNIKKAIKLLYEHIGIVIEPAAAVGIAAIIENIELFQNKNVLSVLCGGNIESDVLKECLDK